MLGFQVEKTMEKLFQLQVGSIIIEWYQTFILSKLMQRVI